MLLLSRLSLKLNLQMLIPPLLLISVANSFTSPSLAKTVLSQAPSNEIGAASGLFYTVYNASRALSQTLVLLVLELGVSSAIVIKNLVDASKYLNYGVVNSLIISIRRSFCFFTFFFTIVFALTLILFFKNESNKKL